MRIRLATSFQTLAIVLPRGCAALCLAIAFSLAAAPSQARSDMCSKPFSSPASLATAQSPIVLNLGGEGEVPGAYNVNSLVASRRDATSIPNLIVADMRHLPAEDSSIDAVICNKCPSQGNFRFEVSTEAFRVLKSGGQISLWSMTGGGQLWIEPLKAVGFTDVRIENGRARALKP